MKVLIVASFSSSLVNFRGFFISALLDQGHIIHVAAPNIKSDVSTLRWLQSRGVECHEVILNRTGLNPFADLFTFLSLIKLMIDVQPDLFLGYTIKPVLWGLLASRITHIRRRVALITGLGFAFTYGPGLRRLILFYLLRAMYSIALRSATAVLFQNSDDKADFERLKILPGYVYFDIIPGSGVDPDKFKPSALPSDPVSFVMISRLVVDKGIREYLAAARLVRDSYPDVVFHLIGGPDQNPSGSCLSEVLAAHESGDIVWHGHLTDVRPILALAQCFVLPSYREGMPRTVLEALATGRPIITTNVPGCRETVISQANGFLVQPRSHQALSSGMLNYIQLPFQRRLLMSQASLTIAHERFDIKKVTSQMLSSMNL